MLAKVHYDSLAFETAWQNLDKAEAIVKDNYPPHSYEYLEMKKEIGCYYKRFQKNDQALMIFKDVMKKELQLKKDPTTTFKEEPKAVESEAPEEPKTEEVVDEPQSPEKVRYPPFS